eukprot:5226414-Amphidinium_carterae.1
MHLSKRDPRAKASYLQDASKDSVASTRDASGSESRTRNKQGKVTLTEWLQCEELHNNKNNNNNNKSKNNNTNFSPCAFA